LPKCKFTTKYYDYEIGDKARLRIGGEGEKKVKEGKYRYVSTQLKDELQVTRLVLIYKRLLPILLFCLLLLLFMKFISKHIPQCN
jgi:hypothetical protein